MGKDYRVYSKTFAPPRRPFEKERLDRELKLCGEFGLKNKREVWRVNYTLTKIRTIARVLLTLPERDPKRVFEGAALLRRLTRLGVLNETEQKLDYCLGLTPEKFLGRRLQTLVFKSGIARSIHHARVMIRARHIRVGKRLVNVPSFLVRTESEKYIDVKPTSPLAGGKPGRVARKNGGKKDEDDDDM